MIINYYGISCFKAQSKETVLAFDPPSKECSFKDFGLKLPRFQADVVLISHNYHKDHNGYDTLSGDPFIIDGPGEYDVKNMRINGISTFHDDNKGENINLNTIYTVNFEGLKLCHFGDFGEEKLRSETKEEIGRVDVLFISVFNSRMNPQKAAKIATEIGPRIVIPMHYHKDEKMLKKFVKETGVNGNPVDKLAIKKKDLEDKETQVIVLKEQ